MMEWPEAATMARQMNSALRRKRIHSAERENSPHKWVFYNRPRKDYERLLPGRTVGRARAQGSHVDVALSGGLTLQLGDGGERIFLHEAAANLPKKYHLLLRFDDGDALSVCVAGWGAVRLFDKAQHRKWAAREGGPSPLDDRLTLPAFKAHLDQCNRPVKAFFVNRPAVKGIGNGYLQDILFRAGLHPRRKVPSLTPAERRKLYSAMRKVIKEAVAKGGRDDELDLFGRPGRYVRTLDRHALGKPCPRCATKIGKISFLGGTCYLCPACQPEP